MVETDDHSIIKQICQGNVEAFAHLVERYQRPVFNLALNMTGSAEDAQDLTQEIFVKAYLNLKKVDPKYKFFSWLYRIAINETVNYTRRSKPFVPLEEMHLAQSAERDDQVRRKEMNLRLHNAILKLKPKHRLLIILKYYVDFSYEQISSVTGIPERKVKSRLFEARQCLRNFLTNSVG